MNEFFGGSTKVVIIALVLGWVLVTWSSGPAIAEDQDVLMDLQRGGVDFFQETSQSIVQFYARQLGPAGGWASAGSGYVVDREGHCITNRHVVEGSEYMEATLFSDQDERTGDFRIRRKGTVLAEDPALDFAVVLIEAPPEKFHPIRLGDSALINAGDACATFGSPGGDAAIGPVAGDWIDQWESNTEFFNLNLGVVSEILSFEQAYWTYLWMSATYETVGARDYGSAVEYLFHTDSAINHGNSGGPCINQYGEAIGTNTWGFGGENLGFSVPINLLKRSLVDILEYGRVRRPWFGVALHPARYPEQAMWGSFDMEVFNHYALLPFDMHPDEIKIFTINPYSPAYDAGLQEGDVILRIDGREYENIFDIYSYILAGELGQEIVVEYERDGHGMEPVVVTLDEKRTRYFGRNIMVFGYGGWSADISQYSSDITY